MGIGSGVFFETNRRFLDTIGACMAPEVLLDRSGIVRGYVPSGGELN
jgi:hypothetical protein